MLKNLESHLDSKEIKPINPKGSQLWIFTGRNDAEPEAPILCYLMPIADLLEKTLMLGKIEGRRRRGWQDEMVGWHDQLNGHNFEHFPGDSEGQKSLVCCRPWGCKEMETTEWLKNNSIKDEIELSLLPLTLLLFNTLTHVFFFFNTVFSSSNSGCFLLSRICKIIYLGKF